MVFYFKVGWRNLWRNSRRTLLTSSAMAISIGLCMAMLCFMDGMYGQMYDVLVTQSMGHIQVHHPDYPRTQSMYDTLQDVDGISEKVDGIPGIQGKSARLYGNFLIGGSKKSAGAQVIAVVPEVEQRMGNIDTQVIEGTYLSSSTEMAALRTKEGSPFFLDDDPMNYPEFDGEILVGIDLAENLDLSIGESLLLFGMNADGGQAEGIFQITGFYRTGSVRKDSGAITHLGALQSLMGLENQVHEMVLVGLNSTDEGAIQSLVGQVNEKLGIEPDNSNIVVKTWMETSPQTSEMMKLRDLSAYIMLSIVFFIAAFGILNTMLMSVFERTRELGVLKALGLRPMRMINLVISEAIMLSLFAAALGLVIGGGLDWLLIEYGINLEVESGEGFSFNGAVFEPIIRGKFVAMSAITPALSMVVVSVFASIWPAIRAARLQPVDAIKQD
jgi:putative ABC transport system permease protein